jgi:hypothetical protein
MSTNSCLFCYYYSLDLVTTTTLNHYNKPQQPLFQAEPGSASHPVLHGCLPYYVRGGRGRRQLLVPVVLVRDTFWDSGG